MNFDVALVGIVNISNISKFVVCRTVGIEFF